MATEQPSRRGGVLKWVLGVILGLLLLGALGAAAWYFLRSEDLVSQGFEGQIDQVVINVQGEVDITAGTTYEVDARREWLFGDAPQVDMALEGGVLRVEANCDSGFIPRCLVSIDAVVPADAEILVESDAGAVTVTGTNAGVDLATDAGSITVDVAGAATLRTSAGSIEGTVRDGDVDASTDAGNIDLVIEGDFTGVSATTDAGSVELTVPDLVYAVDAASTAGEVTVDVRTDPASDVTIRARSSAGNVTVQPG